MSDLFIIFDIIICCFFIIQEHIEYEETIENSK